MKNTWTLKKCVWGRWSWSHCDLPVGVRPDSKVDGKYYKCACGVETFRKKEDTVGPS